MGESLPKRYMATTIMTPNMIWKDFVIPVGINHKTVREEEINGTVVSHVYIDGRETPDGRVQIYGALIRPVKSAAESSVLVIQDLKDGTDLTLSLALAERGHEVLVIDLAGKEDGKELYTIYPESVSYANLSQSVYGKCELDCDVRKTCWYEWSAATAYAAAFLRECGGKTRVGAIGVGGAATALWQAAAVCGNLDCLVFAGNSGWYGYRGINKFGGTAEPRFSDEVLSFIAGVEPQSYARQIKCPVLLLVPTNSANFDCDRAYDTVARMDERIYTAVEYSVGSRETVDRRCFADALMFLDVFLRPSKARASLPEEVEIKGEFKDGQLVVEAMPCEQDLKSVYVYVAEESIDPRYRCWRRTDCDKKEDGKYIFFYSPYEKSGLVTYYAEAVYKSGFCVCSIIEAKSFAPEETTKWNKHKIVYSTRKEGVESMFAEAEENRSAPRGIDVTAGAKVEVRKGPMDLFGLYGKNGLMTFRIIAAKYRPDPEALMMLDVYVKDGGMFTVRLVSDYFGANRTEYSASVKINGGGVWQNVKLEKNRFKTAEGLTLKNYDKIEAMEFYADNEFLINNVLWV